MKKKDLNQIEKRLLQLRERALKDLGHFDESFSSSVQESDGDLSAYSFHMADQGTDAMEREKAFLFASKEGRYLYHLDEALRRLYRTPKQFGICEECGDSISLERLDALPHTRLCIRCKEKEETGASR
ncbi:MAG: TraR/DksA C4-type zinc finger protein [Gemmatimonadota bacterium]